MNTINNEQFGKFLSELRKEKGLTQNQLAQMLCRSDKAVSKWERGLSLPDIDLIMPLAKILGVTTTELLSGKRLEANVTLTMNEVEVLMNKTITLLIVDSNVLNSEKKTRIRIFMVFCLIFIIEIALFLLFGITVNDLIDNVSTVVVIMFCFAVYFTFFIKATLPNYYDNNKISFIKDGFLRINMVGINFNNNNLSQIIKVTQFNSLLVMVVFPLVYVIVSTISLPLYNDIKTALTLCFIFSVFIPMYIVGKKYE